MCYPCSENKGADQLRGYREVDLRLCFRIYKLLVFPWGGSNKVSAILSVGRAESTFIIRVIFHLYTNFQCNTGKITKALINV